LTAITLGADPEGEAAIAGFESKLLLAPLSGQS